MVVSLNVLLCQSMPCILIVLTFMLKGFCLLLWRHCVHLIMVVITVKRKTLIVLFPRRVFKLIRK